MNLSGLPQNALKRVSKSDGINYSLWRWLISLPVMTVLLCSMSLSTQAQQAQGTPDYFNPTGFVDEALAHGLAEVSLAKLAGEKSKLYSTQSYAKQIIDDYTNLNNQLRQLAKDKNLKISSEDELADRAITLTKRNDNAAGDESENERIDLVYARQELAAHERIMNLFHQATQSTDYDIKSFAQRALVVLEKHRQRAEQLIAENDDSTPPSL
jgi:putative membrane protein